jgi:putative FmdB family regulatory protein
MPIYEYECNHCHCHFDKRQRFYDEAVAACPKCQGAARRVLVPVPTIYKGSGFYVTENRKDTDQAKALQEKKETGKTETGKTETGKTEAGKTESAKTSAAKLDK